MVVKLSECATNVVDDNTNSSSSGITTITCKADMLSQRNWLSNTNATLKQITLIVPGTINLLILENNVRLACWIMAAISTLSLVVENLCITQILKDLETSYNEMSNQLEKNSRCFLSNADEEESVKEEKCLEDICVEHDDRFWALCSYLEQPIAPAGISLALLYANSITLGNGMLSGYLLSRGVNAKMIGIYRGIASAIGLLVSPHKCVTIPCSLLFLSS